MATWRSTEELRADPWVVEQVRKAVAKWEGKLRPEELTFMTDQLFETLATHPHVAEVMRVAHPKVGDESGDVRNAPADAQDENGRNRAKG